MSFLIVFVGAGIGGALRHGANQLAERAGWTAFPLSTLVVNVVGSFALGVVAGVFAQRAQLPQGWRLFLATGLLGGFTTFSTFSLDTVTLWDGGKGMLAALYLVASVAVSIVALLVGLALARVWLRA